MDSWNVWYWQVQHFVNCRHKWMNYEADYRSWKCIAHVNICRCCPPLCSKVSCNHNIYCSCLTPMDCWGRTQRSESYWWVCAYPIMMDYWCSCATMSSCRWEGRCRSDSIVRRYTEKSDSIGTIDKALITLEWPYECGLNCETLHLR